MTTQLPLYQSHKKVRAAKIFAIEFQLDGSAKIAADVEGYPTIRTNAGYAARCQPIQGQKHADDRGYYVVYEDGYESWSPTKAFEEGYTLVEE